MIRKSTVRVFDKIDRAVEGELNTEIIGACVAIIVRSIVDSAPSRDNALGAFDALMKLTRQKLIEDWDIAQQE
jgi:hypothetical protein